MNQYTLAIQHKRILEELIEYGQTSFEIRRQRMNATPWGYSANDDIISKLVKAGIPRQEIASIGNADTDAKKRMLFEKVRNGQVRVLIGSTTKMGTGTNVQKRLIALHHLDAP